VNTGIAYALLGAALFGASTPIAKVLVGEIEPVILAGLLYAGSGAGLGLWLAVRGLIRPAAERPRFAAGDYKWLAGAVISGGVVGPALLMLALTATSASAASLLLNLEGVFTALLAWFVFRENFDRRLVLGMSLIVCGGLILGWRPGEIATSWPAFGVAGACLCWALDNNLTRKVSAGDPLHIAAAKGLIAGPVNLCLALATGATFPSLSTAMAAALVGLLSYGGSLMLFVLALRHLGTARTGAYFSVAPFVGAVASLLVFQERPTIAFVLSAVLMTVGVWLHLTERHEHEHLHEALEHDHFHVHDEHHQHDRRPGDPPGERHTHPHQHAPLRHSHPHYPDIHHRHEH